MKRWISYILVILLMLEICPVSVFATNIEQEQTDNLEVVDEYIHYSDLFYAYPFYLSTSELYENNMAAQSAMSKAFDDFSHSPNSVLSRISERVKITTDISQLVKDYSDLIGITDFRYNDVIDAANSKFVSALLSEEQNTKIEDLEDIGKNTKEFKKMLEMLDVGSTAYKELNNVIENNPNIEYYSDSDWSLFEEPFDLTIAYLKPSSIALSDKVPALKNGFSAFSGVLKKCKTANDIYKKFYALIISISMEDISMSLIEDIIATQPQDSVLYEGMTRLRQQLSAGWTSYYIETYWEKELINEVAAKISEYLTSSIMEEASLLHTALDNPKNYYHARNLLAGHLTNITAIYSIFNAVLAIVNKAVFDWILEVPSVQDYQVTMVLARYSNCMYESLVAKRESFNSQFDNAEIEKFETLYSAYAASIKCAIDSCSNLQSNLFFLPIETREALDDAKEPFEDDYYSSYIDGVKRRIMSVPAENRTTSNLGTWTIAKDVVVVGPSDVIEDGYIYCPKTGLKANVTVELGACVLIPEGSSITIVGNIKLICQDYNSNSDRGNTLQNYGILHVTGDVTHKGNGGSGVGIFNHNKMQIDGDLDLYYLQYGGGRGYYFHQNDDSATLGVGGDIVFCSSSLSEPDRRADITAGTVVLNGSNLQEICGLRAYNLTIDNSKGIRLQGNIHLFGQCKWNHNTVDRNGYKVFVYDGVSFADDSDYGTMIVAGDEVNLRTSVKTDIMIETGACLVIPEGEDVSIDGTITLDCQGGLYYGGNGVCKLLNMGRLYVFGDVNNVGSGVAKSGIYNKGKMEIDGNLTLYYKKYGAGYGCFIHQSDDDAMLIVSGDITTYHTQSDFVSGTVVLNGTKKQEINSSLPPTVVLDNKSDEGVIFATAINPFVLFNHNGNRFRLSEGGTFADYDGDGMRDNVDPKPTVGLPCTIDIVSSDSEKGVVSANRIETIGGTEHTVTAEPSPKYCFTRWENAIGQTVSTSTTYRFVARTDDTLTAEFEKRRQPILVSAENGSIQVDNCPEIETVVLVSIIPDDGYIYAEGTLMCDGEPVEGNQFVMPDKPVTLTAEFVKNEAYFALHSAITEAESYMANEEQFSATSFAVLRNAIDHARGVLVNTITDETSSTYVKLLSEAINQLSYRYVVSLAIQNARLYWDADYLIERISIVVTYDNGTEEIVRGSDCTINGYNSRTYDPQEIEVIYDGFSANLEVIVRREPINLALSEVIPTQLYYGTAVTPAPVLTSLYHNDTMLVCGDDYTLSYVDNDAIGTGKVIVTGIGNFEGTRTISFTIECGHIYEDWIVDSPASMYSAGEKHRSCTICGDIIREEIPQMETLRFAGASLTLQNNLRVNFAVDRALLEEAGYSNPYVVFEMDGTQTIVADYSIVGNYYMFGFSNIAPDKMTDTITASLHAMADGVEYTSEAMEYSVAQYCYSMISRDTTSDKLRTLLVDLLNYGAASQMYTGRRMDNLANAFLTAEELAWGTSEDSELTSATNVEFVAINSPSVAWKGASLYLNDSITMQFVFSTEENIDEVKVIVKNQEGDTVKEINPSDMTRYGEYYLAKFKGLNAGQMKDIVYVTAYCGENAISNTLAYSIESYAYSKQNDTNEKLANLVKAMMRYGDSAYCFTH